MQAAIGSCEAEGIMTEYKTGKRDLENKKQNKKHLQGPAGSHLFLESFLITERRRGLILCVSVQQVVKSWMSVSE